MDEELITIAYYGPGTLDVKAIEAARKSVSELQHQLKEWTELTDTGEVTREAADEFWNSVYSRFPAVEDWNENDNEAFEEMDLNDLFCAIVTAWREDYRDVCVFPMSNGCRVVVAGGTSTSESEVDGEAYRTLMWVHRLSLEPRLGIQRLEHLHG